MMPTRLLLLLCLIGPVFATEAPDVDCLIINLKNVSCTWNKKGTPKVNYTFYSSFFNKKEKSCPQYLTENNMNIGCIQPCESGDRFMTFNTRLVHGKDRFKETHGLKNRVKLNPPTNLTVLNGSDFNLWFYWNHTSPARLHCVESEVRFRTNNNNWGFSKVSPEIQKYCINSPSGSSRYELQVRNRIDEGCGSSDFWSDWSEPVFWGSNSSIDSDSVPLWMTLLYVVGAITLILLVVMLLQRERLKIILIPAVPKPSPILHDIEDWFQLSKGLKDNFKASYNEQVCPVREYNYVSQSDSMNSDDSTSSVSTNQTHCSVSIDVNDPEDLYVPLSSSSSQVPSEEVLQVSD
ncbi:cytokine receptor common subunit gamma-like [Pundamilia nyererei]|uniref:Cytokine receptor common subunit gamma-like n=1 Tax=Pundamilia nyererei TaxID=303518 RepID=A0A9Y3VFW8_9CICH|nr:PREDICTED: cytokine receptor common subunit gamma-like [Pundamilia nyererei]